MQHYLDNGFFAHDPVIAYARRGCIPRQFSWLTSQRWLTAAQAGVMRHASDFGYPAGLIVPVHGSAGLKALITFAGSEPDPSLDVSDLAMSALFAHERLRSLVGQEPGDVTLTAREAEALHWIAAGENDARAAEKMAITVRTLRFHLARARGRLGARTRAQAVAIAIYRGLIRP